MLYSNFMNLMTFIVFLIIMSLTSVLYFRKQLLIVLLSLELLVLMLFLGLITNMSQVYHPSAVSFYILIFGACEASMGLTLLVMMTRLKGNDMLSILMTMKY